MACRPPVLLLMLLFMVLAAVVSAQEQQPNKTRSQEEVLRAWRQRLAAQIAKQRSMADDAAGRKGAPRESRHLCGFMHPTSGVARRAERRLAPALARAASARQRANSPPEWKPVQTYVHVLTSGGQGDVPNKVIADQIDVLNKAYLDNGSGFRFLLRGVQRHEVPDNIWRLNPLDDIEIEVAFKQQVRVGDASTLNFYLANPSEDYLGWAYLPDELYELATVYGYPELARTLDGVVVHYQSLPGGALQRFDQGLTLVHEAGHFMGLLHTFGDESCYGPGDYISDTPQQSEPTFGCPKRGDDSCPTLPGRDPFKNFMDYTDDACMNQFTPLQRARMQAAWTAYRSPPAW